jgi:phage shock protein PspC (stress-responsive transcriptional regulator)
MTNPPGANEPARPQDGDPAEPTSQPPEAADRDTVADSEHPEPSSETEQSREEQPAERTLEEPAHTEPTPAEPMFDEPTLTEPADTEPADTEPPGGADTEPPGAVPPPPPPGPPPFPPPPGYPPPGFPPPGFPPPGVTFNRHALVRPTQGRAIAGVCAAVGRATNTDPVLWRVLTAVLTLFGGVGLLAYLLGWLLIPAEGDTASPLEATLGRGRSATSAALVVVLGLLAVLTLSFVVSDGFRPAAVGIAVLIGAVVLMARGSQSTRQSSPAGTGTAPPGPMPPPPHPASMAPPPQPAPYSPPFAPHGPYASSSPYAASLGYPPAPPTGPTYPYPGLNPTPPVRPKPPRERSKLGRLTLSVACLGLGALGAIDLAGASVPFRWYAAVALTVVTGGLLVGAWFGRARWLIPIGAVLSLVLGASTAAGHFERQRVQDISIAPKSVSELSDVYKVDVGSIRLDLSNIDFTGNDVRLVVSVTKAGDVRITLPPNVDADVHVNVNLGDVRVFDRDLGGVGKHETITDNGVDGPGGGHIQLDTSLGVGDLEVQR